MRSVLADYAIEKNTWPLLLAGLLVLLNSHDLPAQDIWIDVKAEDIRVVGTSDWVDNAWGGYRPIQLTITNSGPARELEVELSPPPGTSQSLRVRRTLHLDENATSQFTLDIPQVGVREIARLNFKINGRAIPALSSTIWPGPTANPDYHHVSLLFVGNAQTDDIAFFSQAVDALTGVFPPRPGLDATQLLNRPPLIFRSSVRRLARTQLPNHWLAYSSVDLVAISLADLELLTSEQRGALFEWSSSGGRLLIFNAGDISTDASEAHAQLNRWQWNRSLQDWREPAPETFPKPFRRENFEDAGSAHQGMSAFNFPTENDPELAKELEEEKRDRQRYIRQATAPASWASKPNPFLTARNGFGHVTLIREDLAKANLSDWRWLLADLQCPMMTFVFRHGMESGAGNMEFINLSIPGVQGVPTAAFLVLISLFAIGIGPINFFLLWRKQRLARLIVTIPVLAISTCLLLFLYVVVAQGFGTKGRLRSVTWIDSSTNSATSFSRLSLFSGLTLARGMHFSNRTAVYPLLPYGESFNNGTVDWTNGQHLSDGWFNSRTRTQFVTVETRDNRHRLEVRPTENGLEVTNGFDVDFRFLVITDARGRAYFGKDLGAGSARQLRPISDGDRALIRTFHIETIPEPPDGIEPAKLLASIDRRGQRNRPADRGVDFRWSILERHLSLVNGPMGKPPSEMDPEESSRRASVILEAIQKDTRDPLSRPNGFMAITDRNPGIDLGGRTVQERSSFHMILGTW